MRKQEITSTNDSIHNVASYTWIVVYHGAKESQNKHKNIYNIPRKIYGKNFSYEEQLERVSWGAIILHC